MPQWKVFFYFFNLKSTVKAFQSNMLDSPLKQGKGQGNREGSSHARTELYNSCNAELQELGYQHLKHQQPAPAKNSCHCQGVHLTAVPSWNIPTCNLLVESLDPWRDPLCRFASLKGIDWQLWLSLQLRHKMFTDNSSENIVNDGIFLLFHSLLITYMYVNYNEHQLIYGSALVSFLRWKADP